MPAPRAKIGQKYRMEEIDLQPYGNTISIETPSDNPFEDGRDVEIVTQDSGGLAGPDPKQRSRGLLIQRPRNTKQQGGRVRAFRVTMDAAHPGFMPGMGAIERPMRRMPVTRRARITSPGFMPGMGDLNGPVANRRTVVRRNHNGYMPGMGDDPVPATVVPAAPSTTANVLTAVQQAGSTAADVLKARYAAQAATSAARTSQAMANAEAARAEQMRSASMLSLGSGKNNLLTYGLVAAGVLGLTWAFFLRKPGRK